MARKLVSYQLLAASIDRIICPVSFPGGSQHRPGNRVSETVENGREKQKENERGREIERKAAARDGEQNVMADETRATAR